LISFISENVFNSVTRIIVSQVWGKVKTEVIFLQDFACISRASLYLWLWQRLMLFRPPPPFFFLFLLSGNF
jgi:hypothetical protein